MTGKEKASAKGQQAPVEDLRAVRARKRDELRAAGHHPYSNTFRPRHHASDVRDAVASVSPPSSPSTEPLVQDRFVLAGRIMVVRSFGKASFFDLVDATGHIQVHVRKGVLPEADLAVFQKVDAGDFVGVEGYPFYTRTGELTIMAERLQLVTKALGTLPEKWHGLVDPETRYRQRYLDLASNPAVREIFTVRSIVLGRIRAYLDSQGFVEVETPMLHPIRGGANARPFATHHNALDMDLYLRVAPELYLKRLLVGGLERVYEIGKCFRNEGVSTRHNPEFTILEFYEAYADFLTVLDRAEEMLRFVEAGLHERLPQLREGRQFDLQAPWQRLDMREAIASHGQELGLGRAILDDERALRLWCSESRPGCNAIEPERLGKAQHGALVYELFERLVEPVLGPGPVAILGFPAAVSPLARPSDADPSWTDRFEVFLCGREIINAFSELNDPELQAERFRAQMQARAGGDEEAMDHDHDYVRALEHGMPPAGGFGLGIDRLVMALCSMESIREVILFPAMRPEGTV